MFHVKDQFLLPLGGAVGIDLAFEPAAKTAAFAAPRHLFR
jgi:hypothetical protein